VIRVGGRVRIRKNTVHSKLEGRIGIVKRIDEGMAVNEGTALVKLDTGSMVSCRLNELKEVEEKSPKKQD
jgi:hypothetical protein